MIIFRQKIFMLYQYERGADGKFHKVEGSKALDHVGGYSLTGLDGKQKKVQGSKAPDHDGRIQGKPSIDTFLKNQQKALDKAKADQVRQETRNVIKNNPNIQTTIKNTSVKGYNKGFQKGASSVGIKQGAINTWNGLSTGQKIGVGALGTAAIALPAIAISRANTKRREAEEDLERERRRR